MLKADLHIHTHEDPYDGPWIRYNAEQLIIRAAELGFQVLSITQHRQVTYSKELASFAKSKGILLIPGVECNFGNGDVLVYNITQKEAEAIKSFCDLRKLRKLKKDSILVIAPHPLLPSGHSLMSELAKNIDLFDAIEFCNFYTRTMDWNRGAVKAAREHNKPLIGTSDSHMLAQLGRTYSLLDSKKDIKSVFGAIRQGKVELKTNPMSHLFYGAFILKMLHIRFSYPVSRLGEKFIKSRLNK